MNLIDNLKWRYATKKYDNTKKVTAADVESGEHAYGRL